MDDETPTPVLAPCACGGNIWILHVPVVGTGDRPLAPRVGGFVPYYQCSVCKLKRDAY